MPKRTWDLFQFGKKKKKKQKMPGRHETRMANSANKPQPSSKIVLSSWNLAPLHSWRPRPRLEYSNICVCIFTYPCACILYPIQRLCFWKVCMNSEWSVAKSAPDSTCVYEEEHLGGGARRIKLGNGCPCPRRAYRWHRCVWGGHWTN